MPRKHDAILAHPTTRTSGEIAFGESYRCLESVIEHVRYAKAVEARERWIRRLHGRGSRDLRGYPRHVQRETGHLLVSSTERSNPTPALHQAVPNSSAFPKLSFLMTSMTSSFRKASGQVNSLLSRKMVEGRKRAVARGEDSKELADCVLDLICSRETGNDKLGDRAMRDELLLFLLGGERDWVRLLTGWLAAVCTSLKSIQVSSSTTLAWAVIFLAKRVSTTP